MQSDRDKEQTRTVGVGMAEDVAGVDLAQNVFNGHSGTNHVRRVVHRKNDAGHDLNVQTDAAKATEFPKDVQVTRGWIVVKVAMTGRKSGLFQKSPRVSNGSLHWFVGAPAIENAPHKSWLTTIENAHSDEWMIPRWVVRDVGAGAQSRRTSRAYRLNMRRCEQANRESCRREW